MNEPQQEQADDGSRWRGRIRLYAIIAVGAIFFLMFALPGFVLGYYERLSGDRKTPPAMLYFFEPALTLGEKIPPLAELYIWEYEVAAGHEFMFE